MALPGNGVFVVQSEMAMLVTAMRRSTRWGSHTFLSDEYDVLMRTFQDLKTILNQVEDLKLVDPATFLSPFLEVIRSKETTGPVTSLALQAINKFLSYGLIDPTHTSVPATVEDIADAVTHARFVGTDHASDGVVLMRILQVLRTLMLSPEGAMLTDESVCEIMLSCFRICFESRLSELLRRHAEQCLRDMTQLIFMRLPQFSGEESDEKRTGGSVGLSLRRREKAGKRNRNSGIAPILLDKSATEPIQQPPTTNVLDMQGDISHTTLTTNVDDTSQNVTSETKLSPDSTTETNFIQNRSPSKKHTRHSSMDLASSNHNGITQLLEKCVSGDTCVDADTDDAILDTEIADPDAQQIGRQDQNNIAAEQLDPIEVQSKVEAEAPLVKPAHVTVTPRDIGAAVQEDYVNPRGIRFTAQEEDVSLQPYGVVCVRELFRFLISLCNPLDSQNSTAMVHLGLCLVGTALEVGADQLAQYPSLLYLVRDPLCRNLLSLLNSEKITIFALDLQISFLLFESLRSHLKLQIESFFIKLIEIISADTSKSNYELKEITHISLESLAQIFRIPGICAELYLNYDCDIYCSNIFEDITKLLSKNVVSASSYNIHSLSLDALMTVIEAIQNNCNQKKTELQAKCVIDSDLNQDEETASKFRSGGRAHISLELGGLDDASVLSDHVMRHISQYKLARHKPSSHLPTVEQLDEIKNRKRWIATGTEMFNQKADKGIEFLQEHGILQTPLQPVQVAMFLRENPGMDKKMIGEYICKRSSVSMEGALSVLAAFADSFEYAGLRIDQALRLYLETFRLPGEAPLIFLVMEHFAERWHLCNGSPFANTDAAFRLAYAIIMLNMDQHNHNAKKLNVPMTPEDFVRNLRGCNGSGDFDQAMLLAVFNAIKNEEIVMPAERSGIVRDNYLWKVLLRRGLGTGGHYLLPPPDLYDDRLFALVWGPSISALSSAWERAPAPTVQEMEVESVHVRAYRALLGLEQCAAIVAQRDVDHHGITLDTLVLTMCKFTGLLSLPDNANYITIGVSLGQSTKCQLALRRACVVMSRHADCLRDAWRHLMDLLRALYRGQLIPESLAEAEDYMSPSGKISLMRESSLNRVPEPGLLSSLYSYIALSGEPAGGPTREERLIIDAAASCVDQCHLPGLLVTETKFMQLASLQEMVKHVIAAGTPSEGDLAHHDTDIEDNVIFFLELLSKTIIQNRDRILHVWSDVSLHYGRLVRWAGMRATTAPALPYAAERVITALLRSAVQLMRSEECAAAVLVTLNVLFQLPYRVFYHQSDRISWGLYELVKTSAQNVHSREEWGVVFALLEAAGAGAWPRADDGCDSPNTASSRSDGALSSEDEAGQSTSAGASAAASSDTELSQSSATRGWIVISNASADGEDEAGVSGECESLAAPVCLRPHSASALARCCECLALVVRDVAHITPYNFATCVRCVRTFVEASLHGGKKQSISGVLVGAEQRSNKRSKAGRRGSRTRTSSAHAHFGDEDDEPEGYQMVSIKLLDLMHTLHSRTAQIFRWWREEAGLSSHYPYHQPSKTDIEQGDEECSELWEVAWMPLLQGIARLCTDRRKQKQSISGVLVGAEQRSNKRSKAGRRGSRTRTSSAHAHFGDEDDEPEGYQMVSIKLLDLMHTLHSRTAQIFRWWREEAGLSSHYPYHQPSKTDIEQGDEECSELWEVAWMPLLQGIARLCTDRRKQVCTGGVAYLQRALLAPGLQALQGGGWESCFARVLFPLLTHLQQERPRRVDLTARANTIMCKVFLHHLSALSPRPGFSSLWLRVVALQRALVAPPATPSHSPTATHADADALREAALESLKNMILVMDSVKVFSSGDGDGTTQLWDVTWEKISEFLPHLREELFPQTVQEDNTQVEQKSHEDLSPPASPPISAAATLQAHTHNLLYPLTVRPMAVDQQQLGLSEAPHKSSSIILQPPPPASQFHSPLFSHLGQMVSTPIGINIPAMQSHGTFPILYPNPTTVTTSIQPPTYQPDLPLPLQPTTFTPEQRDLQQLDLLPTHDAVVAPHAPAHTNTHSRQPHSLYTDYLTDPYTQLKDLSAKEATLYEPALATSTAADVFNTNANCRLQNEGIDVDLADRHMLCTAESQTSQHTGTSRADTESGTFNFSSYFGGVYKNIPPGSEMLYGDAMHYMPTQEG